MNKYFVLFVFLCVSISNFALAAGYPPNGYPCLGCKPCPPDFCGTSRAAITAVQAGWKLTASNKIIRDAQSRGFGIQPAIKNEIKMRAGAGKAAKTDRIETKLISE